MSKHDEARRAFLIGAAVGAGAVAGTGLVPEALAQTHEQHKATDSSATTAQSHAHGSGHGAFLNDDDAATVEAFTERLMPGAPGKPGARDAGCSITSIWRSPVPTKTYRISTGADWLRSMPTAARPTTRHS